MAVLLDICSWILLISGAFFAIVGGIGVIRMPDFYTRVHAASLTDTLGMILIVVGLMLQTNDVLVLIKLVLILVFMLVTSPVSAHALAQAALSDNVKPWLYEEGASSKS